MVEHQAAGRWKQTWCLQFWSRIDLKDTKMWKNHLGMYGANWELRVLEARSHLSAIFIQTTYYIVSLQVIAVVCGGLSILLLIISIASTAWLEADMYRQGLWEECDTLENGDVDCRKNETTGNLSCSIQWQNQKKISRYIPLSFWDSRHLFRRFISQD